MQGRFLTWRIVTLKLICGLRRRFGIRRGMRVIHWLYPEPMRARYPIQTTVQSRTGFQFFINTQSWIEWLLFIDGVYEAHLEKLFKRYVGVGGTVIDIGANIGVHTLLFSRLVGESGRVIAVEPYPPVITKLRKHLEHNQAGQVEIVERALSNEAGTATLKNALGVHNEGMASLWLSSSGEPVDEFEVGLSTLDAVVDEYQIRNVQLIKLDIQGSEYAALRGAVNILREQKPVVVFEYDESWLGAGVTFDQVHSFLTGLGYTVYSINDKGEKISLDLAHYTEFVAVDETRAQQNV